MSRDLSELLERARQVEMSATDREEQRRSFAYGSANIENGDVSRELIDQAADRLREGGRNGRSGK